MALSHTSFTSASMVAKVKIAMQQAAHCGYGYSVLYNAKGRPVATLRYRTQRDGRKGFEFWHGSKEVTALVMEGARRFHANV